MFIVERDSNDYAVRSKEPGFGRGFRIGKLTIRQAQIATAHYFGEKHNKRHCPICKEKKLS